MLLANSQGRSRVELRPVRVRSKWVTVAGEVTARECSWSFTHACLTLTEARKLTRWLRKVADAPAGMAAADRLLGFTEPNLAFGCARPGGQTTVAVHLSHESAPPWAQDRQPRVVSLQLDAPELARAAAQWREELAAAEAKGQRGRQGPPSASRGQRRQPLPSIRRSTITPPRSSAARCAARFR